MITKHKKLVFHLGMQPTSATWIDKKCWQNQQIQWFTLVQQFKSDKEYYIYSLPRRGGLAPAGDGLEQPGITETCGSGEKPTTEPTDRWAEQEQYVLPQVSKEFTTSPEKAVELSKVTQKKSGEGYGSLLNMSTTLLTGQHWFRWKHKSVRQTEA